MSEEVFNKLRKAHDISIPDTYVEYKGLIHLTARKLLKYNCTIFHCVSFLFEGKAWLLTAPSGTGKTTQYLNWQKYFPDEIEMICGDMPVLEKTENNMIVVHPTPWNGKENIGSDISAPLGGVICLRQGKINQISDMTAKNGLLRVFKQFVVIPDTEQEIQSLASIIDCIFRNYAVAEFENTGDPESTAMLRSWIKDKGVTDL